ncbi:MAG: PASTA domain-containing protein, partial [Deltaproteobacteria bacterium]|nr:PASTA domain-containing protein [Deltaproteobacteria bacterium]
PTFSDYFSQELVFDQPKPLVAKGVTPVALEDSSGQMPDLEGLTMREVYELMAPYGMNLEYHGTGLATKQEPMVGSSVTKGQTASVLFKARRR